MSSTKDNESPRDAGQRDPGTRRTEDNWPPGSEEDGENRVAFGNGTEGLCQTMPDLGTLPFVSDRAKGRRVVRLVSNAKETDLSIELRPGLNRIGRQRVENHIVLVGPEISRFHAEIEVGDEVILVRDLGSSNGTYVNEAPVGEQELRAGDIVTFSEQFSFQLLIDISLETPESVTLSSSVEEPLPDSERSDAPGQEGEVVPTSLKRRSERLQLPSDDEAAVPAVEPVAPEPVAPAGGDTMPSTELPVEEPPVEAPAPTAAPDRAGESPLPGVAEQPGETVRPPADPAAEAEAAAGSAVAESQRQTLVDAVEELAGEAEERVERAVLERERRQLAVLYQVSKRCMSAESLAELDRLLVNVLERIVSFQRGFITYQLPTGDWKLVMSPKGDRWERKVVRKLLQIALKAKAPVTIHDSRVDDTLGSAGQGRTDSRLLLPLRSRTSAVGTIFLVATGEDCFDEVTVDFLSLFADIAALAVVNCAKLETGG